MVWQEKIWGKVWHLFQSDRSSVSFLEVKKGFQSSRHFHRERANLFAVISGRIKIRVWDQDGEPLWERDLDSGQTCVVGSNLVHQFQVLESGQVIEVYWPDGKVMFGDIVRLDEGGPMK